MKKFLIPITCLVAVVGFAGSAHAAATETLRNLQTAFAGESNAAHRYQAFAAKADAEGNTDAARLFRAAAKAEGIHRDRHQAAMKKLGGAASSVTLDEVKVGTTAENLKAAIAGESYERDTMYPGFIATAKSEDARAGVRSLQAALSAEKEHAKLFQQALDNLGQKVSTTYYVCPECGFTAAQLPNKECPVCHEERAKFVAVE